MPRTLTPPSPHGASVIAGYGIAIANALDYAGIDSRRVFHFLRDLLQTGHIKDHLEAEVLPCDDGKYGEQDGVGIGKDHTLFALVDGHVSFAVKGALNKHTVNVTAA